MNDRSRRTPRTVRTNISSPPAFSLVELLAVIAIISILLVFIAPAIGNFGSTAGRKGAVNILMNTMEQARVAALESGRNVYIVFLQREFPERDALVVLRDPDSDAPPGTDYEQLTRFMQLPKGVLLYSGKGSSILNQTSLPPEFNSDLVPGNVPSGTLSVLQFNSFGGVAFPTDKNDLLLIVSEGVRGAGGTEAVIGAKKSQAGGFEIISLRRFTGRASLEVSTLTGA